MITRAEFADAKRRAADLIRGAGFAISDRESTLVEVADFGLGNLHQEGAQILTLVQTDRFAVKLIVLFPHQTLPEHWHPPVGDDPGKEEVARVVSGTMLVYVAGDDTMKQGFIPPGKGDVYTARHEIVMAPGEQHTFSPGDKHWFQGGKEGAVAFSFSSVARDILDLFSDPAIRRETVVE